jgi:gamma-glutamyltranspeptidase/glutathione hydrolase
VTICEMLNILSGYPLGRWGYRSAAEVHVMTEAMRRAYFDRNNALGDPAFVDNPVARLTSMAYADRLRATIDPDRATTSASLGVAAAPHENANTTHYSVVDRWGNAVAVTYTINDDFGAKVIAGDTGYLLNDEMDDFTAKPGSPNGFGLVQGKANAIAPGKRPLSSMAPTIVLKDGKPVLVVGTPGGARIITTVLEILVAVIDHQIPLQEAVDAPRFHHQWLPDTLEVEPGALTPAVIAALEAMGHKVVPLEPWTAGNAAEVIGVSPHDPAVARSLGFPHTDVLLGANDARTPAGSAAAP